MELRTKIIKARDLIQVTVGNLLALQECLDSIQVIESQTLSARKGEEILRTTDFLMTRKEAADYIGRSLRQLDRLCEQHVIRREYPDGHIRIRKSELLRYKGYCLSGEEGLSELERLHRRYFGGSHVEPGR